MHFDYAFLRNEEGGEKATVLVGRCRQSKFLIAHVVPSKGERGLGTCGDGERLQEDGA